MLTPVEWFGGPHDGDKQAVFDFYGDLPRERRCHCHDALYIAEREDWGWALIHQPARFIHFKDVKIPRLVCG